MPGLWQSGRGGGSGQVETRDSQQVVSGEPEIQQPENSRAAGKFESGGRKSKVFLIYKKLQQKSCVML